MYWAVDSHMLHMCRENISHFTNEVSNPSIHFIATGETWEIVPTQNKLIEYYRTTILYIVLLYSLNKLFEVGLTEKQKQRVKMTKIF